MIPIHVVVNPDKVSARITIGEAGFTLPTAELDSLMRRLIEARPLMLPGVVVEPRPPATPQAMNRFRAEVGPCYDMPDGGAFVHLTHPALGWLTWRLTCETAREATQSLAVWTVPAPRPPAG